MFEDVFLASGMGFRQVAALEAGGQLAFPREGWDMGMGYCVDGPAKSCTTNPGWLKHVETL